MPEVLTALLQIVNLYQAHAGRVVRASDESAIEIAHLTRIRSATAGGAAHGQVSWWFSFVVTSNAGHSIERLGNRDGVRRPVHLP